MTKSDDRGDAFFEALAQPTQPEPRAPARLKARVYSALMRQAAEEGRMRSLTETREAGSALCIFEKFVQSLPLGARFDSLNFCRFCSGRLMGEHMDEAPIPWKCCPYADFHH
jgi:hypothetical protein